MSSPFIAPKMFENAALMKMYQDFAVANQMAAMQNSFAAMQSPFGMMSNSLMQMPNPMVSPFMSPSVMAYQTMLMRTKAIKMMQMTNSQLYGMDGKGKINDYSPKLENLVPTCTSLPERSVNQSSTQSSLHSDQELKMMKIESQPVTMKNSTVEKAKPSKPTSQDAYFTVEVEKIIQFILKNMGKKNQTDVQNARSMYINNPTLLQIYDKLVMKYYSAKKCKEDIVRYILRRVFKILRTKIIKKEKVCAKKASVLLCKRYFGSNLDRIQQAGIDIEDEEQLLEFFMPYRKKSKNKTMNTTFVLEVFSSEEFCEEYEKFLANFDNILADDNNKKMKKMMSLIESCAQNNNISKLGSFNRLPWLDIWIEDTKNIASGLMPVRQATDTYKKIKC